MNQHIKVNPINSELEFNSKEEYESFGEALSWAKSYLLKENKQTNNED